jgi:hypothetical protein
MILWRAFQEPSRKAALRAPQGRLAAPPDWRENCMTWARGRDMRIVVVK